MPCLISARNMASVCDQSYSPGLCSTIPHGIISAQRIDPTGGHLVEVVGARQGAVLGDDPVLNLRFGPRREREHGDRSAGDRGRDPADCGTSPVRDRGPA